MSETHASDSQAGRVGSTQRVADTERGGDRLRPRRCFIWHRGIPPPSIRGIQRLTGIRSEIILQPIVALEGRVMNHFTPPLCNRTLFRRDDHRCLYCGGQFTRGELTRDHVLPISRGGDDKWENVVAACKRCNWLKDCHTPEEAHMPLLAVPFRPNTMNGTTSPKSACSLTRWSTSPNSSKPSATGRIRTSARSSRPPHPPWVIDHSVQDVPTDDRLA